MRIVGRGYPIGKKEDGQQLRHFLPRMDEQHITVGELDALIPHTAQKISLHAGQQFIIPDGGRIIQTVVSLGSQGRNELCLGGIRGDLEFFQQGDEIVLFIAADRGQRVLGKGRERTVINNQEKTS